MNLKGLVFASVLIAVCAGSIQAAEQYRFRVAEGLEALPAEDRLPNMELLRGKPLMVLIASEGLQWRWMLNGCPAVKPCEWRIEGSGGRGSLTPDEDPASFTQILDLGLMRIDATRFRLRCLRESCLIRHGAVGATEMEQIRLLRGESVELSVERVIDVKFGSD